MDSDIREASATGDSKMVLELLEKQPALINHQHALNGWTALHWAAKRNHANIVELLLRNGANKELHTNDGHKAHELTTNSQVTKLLTGEDVEPITQAAQPTNSSSMFTPNYLSNPTLPSYYQHQSQDTNTSPTSAAQLCPSNLSHESGELVLKSRIADSSEKDFIEIELPYEDRTFKGLVTLLCDELKVNPENILKIRKLPNTIIRKDKDVMRLVDFQEVELVLINQCASVHSFVTTPVKDPCDNVGNGTVPRDLTKILY